jgi:hypothetical protein
VNCLRVEASLWKRVLSDYRCQLAFLEGMKEVLADSYTDPREYRGVRGKQSGGQFVSLKKESQAHVPKNVHSLGYLLYAYGVAKTTFFRKRDAEKMGPSTEKVSTGHDRNKPRQGQKAGKTAINNHAIACDFYTPRFVFAREKAMGTTILLDKYGQSYPGWTNYQTRHKQA